MSTRSWRDRLETIGGWAALAIVAVVVLSECSTKKPAAGEECGPHNHYRWVGTGPNADLSCEPDAP